MQFVEHDTPQRPKQKGRVGARQQQRQLFWRGEQNIRWIAALALALRRWRIAGTRLQPHRKPHLAHRNFQVAGDVDGERLQRGNIKGVQALAARERASGRFQVARAQAAFGKLDQGRQEAGKRLAAAGRRDQQRRAAGMRLGQKLELVRARRPAALRKPAREHLRQQRRIVVFGRGCRFHFSFQPTRSAPAPRCLSRCALRWDRG